MTADDVGRLLEQYRAGIDAELSLLRQLADIAHRQHEVAGSADLSEFGAVADARDEVMRSLVTLEEGLRTLRHALHEHHDLVAHTDGYADVVARHRDAAHLVNMILSTDQQSISSLADAELARRSAVASLERGESTLAAYRRVLSPPVATATLFDKVG
jgi:hypothetical protein